MKSALHVAIENGQQEVVWLLLWVASDLPDERFPTEAAYTADRMNAQRPSESNEEDIRSLRNEQGHNAEDLAKEMGGPWNALIQMGIFSN
jgi:hypothetical protein